MTGATEVETHLTNVLRRAAEDLKLKKYSTHLNTNLEIGDGFLGEFFKATIVDEETNTTHYVAMKKSPSDPKRREEEPLDEIYKNEILFYSEIIPTFKKFEEEHQVSKPFNSVPEYISSCTEVGKEVLVLKDITFEGFELRKKDLLLDDEHARFIFKTYGHFHAISFCLKEKRPEEYKKLTGKFHEVFQEFFKVEDNIKMFDDVIKECYDTLDPVENAELKEKFEKYLGNFKNMFLESCIYDGEYSGIVHGDCWSNNMMFKYQDSRLVGIKLLDFQLICVGSPIFDLAYFFYTGGCKELFDNLQHYLDIYHQSFSDSAKKLGCDPETLFPRRVLSEEWKTCAKYGMLLSLFLTKAKLISKEDSVKVIEASAGNEDPSHEVFKRADYDKDIFKKRVFELLTHLNEVGLL